jgi:GNAT superfamily N-acetyltransferase
MAASDPALDTQSTLRADEIGDAEALVRESGWNQIVADWRIFLDLGHVYSVRTGAGRVIATAATLPYGRFAWISMVLVAKEFRRRGLASRLMRCCVDDLAAAGTIPVLDATPAGREVYRLLGFKDTWGFQRLTSAERAGRASAPLPAGVTIAPIDDAVWPALCAYDAAAFGADRSPLLARLRGRLPAAELVARSGERIAGFLMGRDGRTSCQLGPLVAEDGATARALLARAVGSITGPIYIDLADAHANVSSWLFDIGFTVQRPYTRMVLNRSEGFDDLARTFAVAGPELG